MRIGRETARYALPHRAAGGERPRGRQARPSAKEPRERVKTSLTVDCRVTGLESALLVTLRNVTEEDLPIFFEHQRDAVALHMAAFASRERDAFLTHWRTKVLRPGNVTRAIVVGGLVAGYIGSWEQDGKRLVAYWIGREHWGQGIATRALCQFLLLERVRPLHAWVAVHNVGSIRVLEKCGFRTVAQETPQHPDGVPEVLLALGST